jgi:8-oxo-dGTP diphosphatase
MSPAAAILARGPWEPGQVSTTWREEPYDPGAEAQAAADEIIAELQRRGSPSHDGLSGRLRDFRAQDGGLVLELQPMRWSLRLIEDGADGSMTALCVTRSHDGRWLAGRRSSWVASWAGRWALGAGGSVEVGENAAETLARELEEEWSVVPERLAVEALVRLPSGLISLVGQAWLPEGAEPVPDHEHDAWAWWPADPADWPEHADEPLRRMALLLGGAA